MGGIAIAALCFSGIFPARAGTRSGTTTHAASTGDDGLNRVEGGASGLKLVGMALGAAVHSQPLGMAMGAVGASRSIYSAFPGSRS